MSSAASLSSALGGFINLPTQEALNSMDQLLKASEATKGEISEAFGLLPVNPGRKEFMKYVLLNYQLPSNFITDDPSNNYQGAALFLAQKLDAVNQSVIADILLICNQYGITDKHQIAYVLATAKGESEFTPQVEQGSVKYKFEPNKGGKKSYNIIKGNTPCGNYLVDKGFIPERNRRIRRLYNGNSFPAADYAARSDDFKEAVLLCDFNRYAGRGFVQLTGRDNYSKFDDVVEGLVNNPDLALNSHHAVKMLVLGMKEGRFKGQKKRSDGSWSDKRLSHYSHPDGSFDAVKARRIINGSQELNHDKTVYDRTFKKGIQESHMFAYVENYYFQRMLSPFH